MKFFRTAFIIGLFPFLYLFASFSDSNSFRVLALEGDPESFVKSVSVVQGNYVDIETDAVIQGPDVLAVNRFYNSLDKIPETNLGGWRLFPQCYLFIQNDPLKGQYTTPEGMHEYYSLYVGTEKGDTLCYAAWHNTTNPQTRTLFELDLDKCPGLANTARGEINAWTNQKNNKVYYHSESQIIEFFTGCGGKRTYVRTSLEGCLCLQQETLPSGNKIFYQYDDQNRLIFIEMKNHAEKKTISWIKFSYEAGVNLTTSDKKVISYRFTKYGPGHSLLSEVTRSEKPVINYQYEVRAGSALLIKKDLPESRFVQIDYDRETGKVGTVTHPLDAAQVFSTTFSYFSNSEGVGYTEVHGPENRLQIYRYNHFQMTAREDYLSGSLYRVHRKTWGKDANAGNLISSSVEDESQHVWHFKTLEYKENGDLVEEKEFGNLTGANESPVLLDEEGIPEPNQECSVKSYSYSDDKQFHIVGLKDVKGDSLKFLYKPGTNILLGKIIAKKHGSSFSIKKREFFEYNQDGALIRAVVDDGDEINPKSTFAKRHVTNISPKQDLPHLGVPQIVEEKFHDSNSGKEFLIKKVVNHFDPKGHVRVQDIFDSEDQLRYSIQKDYNKDGLLSYETDPEGRKTTYDYDVFHNLRIENHVSKGIANEYDYNFYNQCIHTIQRGAKGEIFERSFKYNGNGNLILSIERNKQENIYQYDDLGRLISASYPSVTSECNTDAQPVFTYHYDIFDNAILVKDPAQRITRKTFTVRGQPTLIQYPDGTEELFKYDTEGSLHRHRTIDGTTQVIEYDYLGRINHIQRYPRGNKPNESGSTNIYRMYDAFNLVSETNEMEVETFYEYDRAGRLMTRTKGKEKTDFQYDSLGRVSSLKKWKTDSTYTLQVKDYNLLSQVVEERLEDHLGTVLLKKKFMYGKEGLLKQVIGYPNNLESVLVQYEYDGLGRVAEMTNGLGFSTTISYQDFYLNSLGQHVLKRTFLDPAGSQVEEIFDVYNRPALVLKKNSNGDLLYQQEICYDTVGNKTLEKYLRLPQGEGFSSFNLKYRHEKGDLITSQTHAEGSSLEATTVFSYNRYNDLESQLFPENKEPILYKYYGLGYLKSLSFNEKKASKSMEYEFEYNQLGLLREVELPFGCRLNYAFDTNDRLTSEKITNGVTNKSYTVSCSYDKEGAITSIKLPDGSLINYSYHGPFVAEVSRLTKEKSELYKHRLISYDLMGNILEEILPFHGGSRKQSWDSIGRRTAILTDFFQDKVPENGYDPLDRLTQREIIVGSAKSAASYTYTDLSQLATEKGISDHTYTYDSLDNRLSKDRAAYKNNDLNQLIAAGEKSYEFNLNGNLISQTSGAANFTYEYNPLNQLVAAKDAKENTISFTYDAEGKRLTKKVETKDKKSKVFRYFYLGDTELGCLDENDSIVELRIPLNPNQPERSSFIGFELKKNVCFPIYDLQGNVACLINAKQRKIIESYQYSAFGEETILNEKGEILSASSVGNPWRFYGKRIDQETGLVYFGKRYYDPSRGRWISPDPSGAIDGPNLYAFVHNNPFSWTDYFGLAADVNASQNKEFLEYFKGEYEPHCACEVHRECRRGGDIGNAIGGALLGAVRFGSSILQGMAQQYGALAMQDALESFPLSQRELILEATEQAWRDSEQASVDFITYNIDFDPVSRTSQNFQSGTYYSLFVADLLRPSFKNPRHLFKSLRPIVGIEKTTGIRGWKVGDSIRNLTQKGNVPTWNTVRARYWKNQAYLDSQKYTLTELERLKKGLAPQRRNLKTGRQESKELHHQPPQKDGGLFDFMEVWPDEHAMIDQYRRLGF